MDSMGKRRVHAYAASFGDDLARGLIIKNTREGDTLLDPFSGMGTTLVQARLLRRNAIGIDVDPVACLIAVVTSRHYEVDELNRLCQELLDRSFEIEKKLASLTFDEDSWSPGKHFLIDGFSYRVASEPRIAYWFAPVHRAILSVLVELAKEYSLDCRTADVVRLVISSVIIRKWPNTLSLARDIDHSRPHRVTRDDLTPSTQMQVFRRGLKTVISSLVCLATEAEGSNVSIEVMEDDVLRGLARLESGSIDYVLTSPPYFNAIDYPRAHKFSQWWLWPEREPLLRKQYIGLRLCGHDTAVVESCMRLIPEMTHYLDEFRKSPHSTFLSLCRYVLDLDAVIQELYRVLKEERPLTFILADNNLNGTDVPSSTITSKLLERNGFVAPTLSKRNIEVRRRRYPYGITGFKGLMNSEYIISATKRKK